MRSEEKEEEGEEEEKEEKEEKEEIVERGRAEDCSYSNVALHMDTRGTHARAHTHTHTNTSTHTHNGNRKACGGLQRTAHTDSAAVRQTQTGCSHRPACCLKLMKVSGC